MRFIKNMDGLLDVSSSRVEQEVTAPMGGQLPAPIESKEVENVIDKRWKGCVLFHPHAGKLCNIDWC